MRIDPWSSELVQDYEHVFKEFGLQPLPADYSKKLDFHLFRRKIVFAHRDFERVMEKIVQKKPFINITGIASSGKVHFGHKVDIDLFVFFKSLGARNYFASTDIDAYVSRPDSKVPSLEKAKEYAVENLSHALALGLEKKDCYVQSRKEQRYYEFAFELSKKITENMHQAIYGHVDLGKVSANLLQFADILHPQLKEYEGEMPSVTGIGLDQDPHARLTRDIAKRLPYGLCAPSFAYFKHQSGLQQGTKMSSSDPYSAIYLSDSQQELKKKLSNAFTGGRNTEEEQRKLGGQPDICKVYEMALFHHPDDSYVQQMYQDCVSGKILCGECKQKRLQYFSSFLKKHQALAEKKRKTAEQIVFG